MYQLHHVRVIDRLHDLQLTIFKPLILQHLLDRHLLVVLATPRLIHHAEGPVSDDAHRLVANLPRRPRRARVYHVSDLIRITIDSQRLVHLFPSPSSRQSLVRPLPRRPARVPFNLNVLISHSRHPSPSLAFLSLVASLAHRVSRRHARDRQRLDLLRLDRRHRRRVRPRVAFARASVASSRRFVDSFRVARRRFDAARLVARRASRRRASDVRRRRPSRVVAVCRAPSSRRFAPRGVEATRRSVWFVWSYPTVRVRLGSIRGRRRSSTPFHRARVADDHGDAAPADEVVRARG